MSEDLTAFTDADLIKELRFRGVLRSKRQTVHVPGGLEAWVMYSTQWLVEDEVFVELSDHTEGTP